MKNAIKSIIFIVIFMILFHCINNVLWLQKTSISYFYEEPKNSLDVVYIGSSNAYAHFNTVLAYHEYGFTTGLLSVDSQPFSVVKSLLVESRKYQNPKLYVIDLTKVATNLTNISDADVRRTFDSMPFSINRIQGINETLKYMSVDKSKYLNYYFSFFMYHNMWKELDQSFFTEKESLYKGYLMDNFTVQKQIQSHYEWVNETTELNKENQEVLRNLLEYIKKLKLDVIFVIPKRKFESYEIVQINEAVQMIKHQNMQVINFNIQKDFVVNNDDFYNSAHLNVYGSTKYTLYFSRYLNENYALLDHRNDQKYISWNKEYDRFKKDFTKLTNQNFDEVLKDINK